MSSSAHFAEIERLYGYRFNFHTYPHQKEEASQMVLPLSMAFTPLKQRNILPLDSEPNLCKNPNCRVVLNMYCRLDPVSKLYVCPFCYQRNPIVLDWENPGNRPEELKNITVEYKLPKHIALPISLLYIVDTCIPHDELDALRSSISQSISLLPDQTSVGLITFGSTVSLWELGFQEMHKAHVFSGKQTYPLSQLQEHLSLKQSLGTTQSVADLVSHRFIITKGVCELLMTGIIDELSADNANVKQDTRPQRAVGCALELGLAILEMSHFKGRARAMMFLGGVGTKGPGAIVSLDLKETLRTHTEIRMEQAPHFAKAEEFYKGLASRFVESGIACDLFVGCLDQVGVTEMHSCAKNTGGMLLLTDTFKGQVFQNSLPRFFERERVGDTELLNFGTRVSIEIQTSHNTKLAGLIGPLSSCSKMSPCVHEGDDWGIGKTCAWKAASISYDTTVSVYMECCGAEPIDVQQSPDRFIQILTSYIHADGTSRLRVTTIKHKISPSADTQYHISPFVFDQEAAAALVARAASYMMATSNNDIKIPKRYIDRMLIRFCKKYGTYTPNQPESLKLTGDFSLFPGFLYHLRRSEFLQVFNSSPDETAFFRMMLDRESVENNIAMIQPTLMMFTFDGPPKPVLLDSRSVTPDSILVLDSYFDVVVHYGSTIAGWVEKKYHESPEHERFRQFLLAPKAIAQEMVQKRFPAPVYTECNHMGSQARKLTNKLNPAGNDAGETVLTDDASLQTFMNALKHQTVATT